MRASIQYLIIKRKNEIQILSKQSKPINTKREKREERDDTKSLSRRKVQRNCGQNNILVIDLN
jgi:hypothetical protein